MCTKCIWGWVSIAALNDLVTDAWSKSWSTLLKLKVKCDHCSKFSNLSNWKEEAWKKSGLHRDSNPWPLRYRCDALPTELWSHTLGARSIYWVHIFPCSEMMCTFLEFRTHLEAYLKLKSWLILCRHNWFLINILFGTLLTPDQQSANGRLSVDQLICINQKFVDPWVSLDELSTQILIKCQSMVDQGYWSIHDHGSTSCDHFGHHGEWKKNICWNWSIFVVTSWL